MVEIKICGITTLQDAAACVDLGVHAIGINFWEGSKRHCDLAVAAEIARQFGSRITIIGVYVNASPEQIERTREATGIRWAQLHGDEPPDVVGSLLPDAFKAIRVEPTERQGDLAYRISRYPGEHVLLDTSVAGHFGGSGQTFDWAIAQNVAPAKKLTLAGGLTADNVGAAIAQARPYRVDVASGVESSPGIKDHALLERFVSATR